MLERLRPLSEDLSLKKIIADRMVLNATFLVKRERELEFNAATQQLDAELGARLSFKYIGSAPPYSFVNLLLSWGA